MLINDEDWMEHVKQFLMDTLESANANHPTLYASRIDGCLLPFSGKSIGYHYSVEELNL